MLNLNAPLNAVPPIINAIFASVSSTPPSGVVGATAAPAAPVVLASEWLKGKNVYIANDDKGLDAVITALRKRLDQHTEENPLLLCLDSETTACSHVVERYKQATAEHAKLQHAFSAFPNLKQCPPDQLEARAAAQRAMEEHRDRVLHPAAKATQKAGLKAYDGQVRLIQLYTGHDSVVVIDRWNVSATKLGVLYKLLMQRNVIWLGHNIAFDVKMMSQHGCTPARAPHCTMLLHQAMTSLTYLRRTLRALCESILNRLLEKDLQMSDWSAAVLTTEQIEYAAADVVATFELFGALRRHAEAAKGKLMPNADPIKIYDLMRGSLRATNEIALSGIGFNKAKHKAMADKLKADYDTAVANVTAAFAESAAANPALPVVENPGSNVQVAKWIEAVKVGHTWPRTPTGQLCVGKNDLKANIVSIPTEHRPPVEALIQWARSKKDYSNFGHDYGRHVCQITQRIHANFRIGGAETGRFSVTDPALQTINRDSGFRAMFEAMDGCTLVARDFGQIELRVGACVSGDKVLLGAIQDGLDIHSLTASACFAAHPQMQEAIAAAGAGWAAGDPFALVKIKEIIEYVTKGPGKWMRQSSKNALFGLIFGQGPSGLQDLMRINGVYLSLDECKNIQTRLLELFPRFRAWMIETRSTADRTGVVWTKHGRVYKLGERGSLYTKSINTPCQGGAAEIMSLTLCCFPDAWEQNKLAGRARLVHVVHDELVAECHPDAVEETGRVMQSVMHNAALALYPNMPTTGLVGGGAGVTWAEAK